MTAKRKPAPVLWVVEHLAHPKARDGWVATEVTGATRKRAAEKIALAPDPSVLRIVKYRRDGAHRA